MKKIRIAHIAGGLTTGGVESVIYNYFSHMDREAYELIYISYDTPDDQMRKRFEALGFTVYTVTKKKENFFKSCREVYKILRKHRVQIVHSHMSLMCFVTNILGRMAGARVLISHSHLVEYPKGLKQYICGLFKLLSQITATDWFACSKEAGIYLFGENAYSGGKVYLMKNAIDLSEYRYDEKIAREMRRKTGTEHKAVIGNVGRFTEQKNQEFVLEIFREFHRRETDSCLLLVGSGPRMLRIQNQAKEMGLEEAVVFTGSDASPSKYYMAMDAFVFPSRYEGLGIAAVEAQAASLPVLASDVVPGEIVVSDYVKFLPLSSSASVWAEELKELLDEKRRTPEDAERLQCSLQQHHYDIRQEVDWLDDYYKRSLKRR